VCDICSGLSGIRNRVDVIITNPPYYQKDPRAPTLWAFHGGASNEFMVRLAEASLDLLSPRGSILMVLSSDVDESRTLEPFTSRAFQHAILTETRRFFELIHVVRLDRTAMPHEAVEQTSTRS